MWYIARWNLNLPYICIDRYKLLCVIRVSNTPRMPRIWISLFMRTSRDISLRQFNSNSWIIKFLEDTLQLSLIDVMWKYIVYKVMKKRKKNKKKKVSKHMPHSCFHGIRSSYAHAYTPNVVTYIYIYIHIRRRCNTRIVRKVMGNLTWGELMYMIDLSHDSFFPRSSRVSLF